MLGKGDVILSNCEKSMVSSVRRSLALSRNYEEGETIQENDMIWVRPGNGFVYGQEFLVKGQTVKRKISKGSVITKEDIS
jgi:sialic acid synthase SpsE